MKNSEYGPLAGLIGNWRGEKGLDVAPEQVGDDREPFYETLFFEGIGSVTNAGKQELFVLRYHQVVYRKRNDEVFHNETGYWMWSESAQTVMHSLTIPRGVCVLAGGKFTKELPSDSVTIEVNAVAGDPDWGIIESPFMRDNASTRSFSHKIVINGNQMTYSETTMLDIYGREFEHTDNNTLARVIEA